MQRRLLLSCATLRLLSRTKAARHISQWLPARGLEPYNCFLPSTYTVPSYGVGHHSRGGMSVGPMLVGICRCLSRDPRREEPISPEEQTIGKHHGSASKLVETPSDSHTLLVIQPEHKSGQVERPYVPAENRLDEAVSLAEAITDWQVHSQRTDAIRKPHNRFLFGKGKIEELTEAVKQLPISAVFINVPMLTPLQHRTLEDLFEKDVFDRFSIILRIFKERAKTHEAKVQVALAEIPYLRSRLIEEDVDFDQQRGGTGKMGGGGETSLETMKRNLHHREKVLKQQLKDIRLKHHTASVHRTKHSLPVVAVVGYTNAGKTTLVKALSKDDSMQPNDMLFATLDTTLHAAKLPCGERVLLVDTIGFISDLPHELVESFASTLEDVTNADVIVHLRDASHPQYYAQRANVMKVLQQLNLRPSLLENMVEVLNKCDKVDTAAPVFQPTSTSPEEQVSRVLQVSAVEGTGLEELMLQVEEAVMKATHQTFWKITIPADGPQLSWLHHEATVCSVTALEGAGDSSSDPVTPNLEVVAVLTDATLGKLRAKFGNSITLSETENPDLH